MTHPRTHPALTTYVFIASSLLQNQIPNPAICNKKIITNQTNQTSHNFGLLDRTYDADKVAQHSGSGLIPGVRNLTQWERFHRQLEYLNSNSPKHVSYKLFFLGRHGEGWHNAAEDYFGTPAWNVRFSLLPTLSPLSNIDR